MNDVAVAITLNAKASSLKIPQFRSL